MLGIPQSTTAADKPLVSAPPEPDGPDCLDCVRSVPRGSAGQLRQHSNRSILPRLGAVDEPKSNWNGMMVLWPAAGASPASAQKLSRRPQLAASPPKFHGLPLTCMHSWGRAESMGDGQGKEGVGLGVTV